MSQSIIETQRAEHAYVDSLEAALTSLLAQPPSKIHRDRLTLQHRAANLLDRIVDRSNALVAKYADVNHERSDEVDRLGGNGQGLQGSVTEFYDRLAKVKEHHRRYPEAAKRSALEQEAVNYAELEGAGIVDGRDFLDRQFAGEEALGRYFDLVALHEQFINLPPRKFRGMNYLEYLDRFDKFDLIPRPAKGDLYSKYVESLLAYFEDFCKRALPLFDLDKTITTASTEFATKWEADEVEGWKTEESTAEAPSEDIWCAACQRMYAKQSVYDAHLTSKKHVKLAAKVAATTNGTSSAAAGPKANGASAPSTSTSAKRSKEKAIARVEYIITTVLAVPELTAMRKETKANVERRQALTDSERLLELEEMEERERKEAEAAAAAAERKKKNGGEEEEEEEDEERIYNPLKLPLGWDGKPIPYWLYKLHGLGVEFTCQICSGHVYMGRKNFDRHFQESRHSFGMRALGLPNTRHFHEITKIEDAIALAEKLKAEGKQAQHRVEEMEELEDAEGNVYNRKTYEDLAKQGLL